MSKYFAVVLAITIGALSSIQAAINTDLGKQIGGVGAALISFCVGTVSLTIVYFFSGESGLKGVVKVSPHLWIGGLLGAMFVYGMIRLVPVLGVGSVMAGAIAGQLILALFIDQFGWFGVTKVGIDWIRAFGAVLLLIGVKMITK